MVTIEAKTRLKVAIAGAGLMGRWHARYARQCGGHICAVADPDPKAAAVIATGGRTYPDVKELLRQIRPDVLHICTPAVTHAEIAGMAIEAGVHVLVEKPVTPEADATRQLVRMAAAHRLLIAPVHQFVLQDGFVNALSQVGRIGRILHVDAVFCSAGASGWPNDQRDNLAAEILPHPLSLIERLLPGALRGSNWSVLRSMNGEWRAVATSGTVSFSILLSASGRPTECSLRVTGDRSTAHLDLFHGFTFTDAGTTSRWTKITHPFDLSRRRLWSASSNLMRRLLRNEPAYPGLRPLIRSFYKAVQTGTAPPISVEELLAVAETRDLLIRMGKAERVDYPQ